MNAPLPLVSVLTPVYNGEPYLAQCIESVLAQTYENWEYIIVNNCSTDRSLDIARSYAARNSRVRVHNNNDFVGVIENHNIALSLIAPESKYVKIVSADDWLYPECIAALASLAERNPSVGIVGSYALSNTGINCLGMPYDKTFFKAFEICRPYLMGHIDSFATPSSVLYRADIIRTRTPFFPTSEPSADLDAAMLCLQQCDFGFVHQILSFQRVHSDAISHSLRKRGSFLLDRMSFLAKYGSAYLTSKEHSESEAQLLREYHELLASSVLRLEGREFWDFQRRRLAHLGYPLYSSGLALATLRKLADLLFNPKLTLEKLARRLARNERSGEA